MNDAEFEREKAALREAIVRSYNVPPKLIGVSFPLRTRLRLGLTSIIDRAGIWLCCHHATPVAEALWRVCRLT